MVELVAQDGHLAVGKPRPRWPCRRAAKYITTRDTFFRQMIGLAGNEDAPSSKAAVKPDKIYDLLIAAR